MRIPSALATAGVGKVVLLPAFIAPLKDVLSVDPDVLGTMGDGYSATAAHGQTLAIGDRRADASHRFVGVFEQATILAGSGTSRTNDGRHIGIDLGLGFGRKELVDGERGGLGLLGSIVVALEGDVSEVDDEEEALMVSIVEVEGVVGDDARTVPMVGEGARSIHWLRHAVLREAGWAWEFDFGKLLLGLALDPAVSVLVLVGGASLVSATLVVASVVGCGDSAVRIHRQFSAIFANLDAEAKHMGPDPARIVVRPNSRDAVGRGMIAYRLCPRGRISLRAAPLLHEGRIDGILERIAIEVFVASHAQVPDIVIRDFGVGEVRGRLDLPGTYRRARIIIGKGVEY